MFRSMSLRTWVIMCGGLFDFLGFLTPDFGCLVDPTIRIEFRTLAASSIPGSEINASASATSYDSNIMMVRVCVLNILFCHLWLMRGISWFVNFNIPVVLYQANYSR